MSILDVIAYQLCRIGLHRVRRTRRGNKFYCARGFCGYRREWKKRDK